jgi:hypothetical protein
LELFSRKWNYFGLSLGAGWQFVAPRNRGQGIADGTEFRGLEKTAMARRWRISPFRRFTLICIIGLAMA